MGQRLHIKTRKDGKAKGVLIRTNTPSLRDTLVSWTKSENDKNSSKKQDNWLARLLRSNVASTFKNRFWVI